MLARHQRAVMQLSQRALNCSAEWQFRATRPQHSPVWQANCRRPRQFSSSRSVSANLIAKKDAGQNVAWTQDEGSLCIGLEVSDGVKGKDVNLEVHPTRMKLKVQHETVLEGSFPAAVVPDGCFFAMETADNNRMCVITIEKRDAPSERWVELFEDEALDASITDQAFLDISIGSEDGQPGEPQRVQLGLYGAECPKTVKNFLSLCTGTAGVTESDKPLHYKGSSFHRIIKGFMLQGGDFTNGDGTGGESIYGRTFEDESTRLKHDQPMKLCMANAGPDTNGSQFYITFVPCPHLDGNHVVFGEVLGGQDVIKRIEEEAGSAEGHPLKPVTITDCGLIEGGSAASDSSAPEEVVAEAAVTGATA